MPYAIFYNGHYAVHGTNQVGRLGRPASAGCVRLDTRNAAVLYRLARQEGLKNTRIVVRR
jgi:lipoprotein-anchoring transpeptidase ErfK/SrfK